MTENNDLNFVKQNVVSVSERERNRKLEVVSFILAGLLLFLTVATSVFNIYILARLAKVKDEETNLIAQIQSPDSKNKESLFFLTKNRLAKIKDISSSVTKTSDYLKTLSNINNSLKIDSFTLTTRQAKVTFIVDNYQKFQDFLGKLKDFNINEKSMTINQVTFSDNSYNIPVQFLFN
jgi:hypothetical protein